MENGNAEAAKWFSRRRPAGDFSDSGEPLEFIYQTRPGESDVLVRNPGTDQVVGRLSVEPRQVNDVAYSPQAGLIATASGGTDHPWPVQETGKVQLWDARTLSPVAEFDQHWGAVSSVCFTPDGEFLASGSYDGTVKLWRLEFGERK